MFDFPCHLCATECLYNEGSSRCRPTACMRIFERNKAGHKAQATRSMAYAAPMPRGKDHWQRNCCPSHEAVDEGALHGRAWALQPENALHDANLCGGGVHATESGPIVGNHACPNQDGTTVNRA